MNDILLGYNTEWKLSVACRKAKTVSGNPLRIRVYLALVLVELVNDCSGIISAAPIIH
jgi:hypothetical protein